MKNLTLEIIHLTETKELRTAIEEILPMEEDLLDEILALITAAIEETDKEDGEDKIHVQVDTEEVMEIVEIIEVTHFKTGE